MTFKVQKSYHEAEPGKPVTISVDNEGKVVVISGDVEREVLELKGRLEVEKRARREAERLLEKLKRENENDRALLVKQLEAAQASVSALAERLKETT